MSTKTITIPTSDLAQLVHLAKFALVCQESALRVLPDGHKQLMPLMQEISEMVERTAAELRDKEESA
jgi:hypothetical protein